MVRGHSSGTSQRAEPAPSPTSPEQVDVSTWTPSWTTGLDYYAGMALLMVVSAVADAVLSTWAPRWGWWFFECSVILVPIGALLYKMDQCVAAICPLIERELSHGYTR